MSLPIADQLVSKPKLRYEEMKELQRSLVTQAQKSPSLGRALRGVYIDRYLTQRTPVAALAALAEWASAVVSNMPQHGFHNDHQQFKAQVNQLRAQASSYEARLSSDHWLLDAISSALCELKEVREDNEKLLFELTEAAVYDGEPLSKTVAALEEFLNYIERVSSTPNQAAMERVRLLLIELELRATLAE
jgi:hypothetical protein